jgi:hypothetical protein
MGYGGGDPPAAKNELSSVIRHHNRRPQFRASRGLRFARRRQRVDGLAGGTLGCVEGHVETPEYWIPAEDLSALNASIVGQIKLVAEYHYPIPQRQER